MMRLILQIILSASIIDILRGVQAFSSYHRPINSPSTCIHTSSNDLPPLYYRESHEENPDRNHFSRKYDSHRLIDAVFTATNLVHTVIKEASEIDKFARKGIGKLKGKEIYEFDDLRKDISDSIVKVAHFVKTKDYSFEAKVLDEIIHLLRLAQDSMMSSKEKDLIYQELADWDRRLLEETILPMQAWQIKELKEFEKLSSRSNTIKDEISVIPSSKLHIHLESLEDQKRDFEKRHTEMEMIASSLAGRMQRQQKILEQNGYVWNHLDS